MGMIMSVFNNLMTMNERTQYAIICSTYDMAYTTFKCAQKFQQNIARQFSIGFISKESSDMNGSITNFNMLICTPSEILTKFEDEDAIDRVTHVVFDDADAYMPWQKTIELIEKIPNAIYIVLSSQQVPEINQILSLATNETFRRSFDTGNADHDRRHHVKLIPRPMMSTDEKIVILNEVLKTVALIVPSKQTLVFCYVSHEITLSSFSVCMHICVLIN